MLALHIGIVLIGFLVIGWALVAVWMDWDF